MSDWSSLKIFFPGPTWVSPEVRAAMGAQVLHHRTAEFRALHASVAGRLRELFRTRGTVLLLTASGTGLMEAAVRNLVRTRALVLANGAFGERLHQIALANGKEAERLDAPWGRGLRPEPVREALASGRFDSLLLVHNETSTGVVNPLEEIAAAARDFPDVVVAVDAVSSLGGVPIDVDRLGLDFVFAGVQKCLALPPGLGVAALSGRALERARSVPARGLYFDLVKAAEAASGEETPWTPSVPHVAALDAQLARILAGGLEARFRRHRDMAERVRGWALARLGLFAEEGYRSDTVTAVASRPGLDVARLLAGLRERGFVCANGYGKLKGSTFRIGHMGDLLLADVEELLAAIDALLAEQRVPA